MPYVLKGEEVPTEVTMFDKAIFYTMLSINILVPLLFGICTFILLEALYNEGPSSMLVLCFEIFSITRYFLQIISGLYLGYAIYKI